MNKNRIVLIVMTVFVLGGIPAYATPEQDTVNALTALEKHILGTPTLNGTQIAAHKATFDTNQALFGTSTAVISAGFSFIGTYDTQIGALWVQGSPIQSINRDTTTDSDIQWSVWNVMQYIMDYTYTADNVAAYGTLLDGKLFESSADFPGSVNPAVQRTNNYSVVINAGYPDTIGWTRFQEGPGYFSRRSTGTYAAPGDIVEVTVPASMINQGYRIRVGCHSWDFSTSGPGPLPTLKRLDRVSLVYDITSATTKVANPLGGGIYIEVPFGRAGGAETVQITGAVRSPFFSVNSVTGNNTTVAAWKNIERNYPAPWADFQTEKFMMNVPTGWISELDRPDQLMADWDRAMDIYNDLMGFPHVQGRESSYFQVDVSIRGIGALYPGWPQCNISYNPDTDYTNLDSWYGDYLIKGPQVSSNGAFHEEGHGYLFPKFPGETESTVNLGYVPILNQGFGYDLDYAFAASMGQQGNPYHTLDHTAVVWMTSFNFVNGAPMGEKEKKYQLPGHAKFVNIARIFGWQVLNDYFKSFVDYYEEAHTKPFDGDTDEHILRLSKAADCDLTPFLYFWGIQPANPGTLAADIAAANLTNAAADRNKIYDEIYRYTKFVPKNNAEFQEYAFSWWGRVPQLDATDQAEREDAQQWDTYDESSHDAIIAVINSILATYYPGGDPIPDAGPPTPDPMYFAVAPHAESDTVISMTAVTATDDSGDYIEYYFAETSDNPGGTDSGWQLSPSYTDTGLNPNTQYTYTVQTRDIYLNTSTPWAPASATTDAEGPVLYFKASNPLSGAGSVNWKSLTADSSKDWTLGTGITLEDVTSTVPTITKAYHFENTGVAGPTWGSDYKSTNDGTWELWVKPSDTGDPYQTIFESGANGKGIAIWYTVGTDGDNTGTISFTIDGGSGPTQVDTVSAAIDTTEFRHIVCDFDENYNGSVDRMKIFVDGVLAADNSVTNPTGIADWFGTDGSGLGKSSSGYVQDGAQSGVFTGDIWVLRFWQFTTPLTDAKVAQLYSQNFEIETAPSVDAGVDMVAWSGAAVQLAPTVTDNDIPALTYNWTAELPAGVQVSFDPSQTAAAPSVTFTKVPNGSASTVNLTLAVQDAANPAVSDSMTVDLYDDNCSASIHGLNVAPVPTDFNGDCKVNIEDLAILAKKWLVDYAIGTPVKKSVE